MTIRRSLTIDRIARLTNGAMTRFRSSCGGACVSFRRLRRSGFTLVELLVALALTVILITAVYSAIGIYLRVSQDEDRELQRSLVARALFRRMAVDLQSIVFTPPGAMSSDEEESDSAEEFSDELGTGDQTQARSGGPVAGTGTGTSGSSGSGRSSGGLSEEDSWSIEVANVEDGLVSTSIGLIGDSQKLTVHISRPPRDAVYQSLQTAADMRAQTSDLQSVTWFLADGSAGGLEGAVAEINSPDQVSADASSRIRGLARLSGDEMAVMFADIESDIEMMASNAELLAPEVVSLQFRYFDGLDWYDSWDSVTNGRLPNAVEITVGMRDVISENERRARQATRASEGPGDDIVELKRHVVNLPLAPPFLQEL